MWEERNYGTFIQWTKIGIDETQDWEAKKVGTKVKWFDTFPELNFEKSDYLKMLENFKAQYELDKIRIEEQNREINEKQKHNTL